MTTCPKCQYQRTAFETAPAWQCPRCGVAYSKVAAPSPPPVRRESVASSPPSGRTYALLGMLLLGGVGATERWFFSRPAVQPALAATVAPAKDAGTPSPQDSGMLQAENDYKSNLYAKALPVFSRLADQGVAVAEQHMGHIYVTGVGADKNHALGMSWLNKAAAQGNTAAEVDLGFVYELGVDEAQDYGQAVSWYRKAAEHGDCVGQSSLAWQYGAGTGVSKNPLAAYLLLQLASSAYRTDPQCQQALTWVPQGKLGSNPFLPESVTSNPQDLANMRRDHTAFWAQGDLAALAKTMSPGDVTRARAMAADWKPGQPL